MSDDIRKRCEQIFTDLDRDYEQWESSYKELAQYINPRNQRFTLESTNKNQSFNRHILDPTATRALQVASAGMFSGIVNPSTKWLRLTVSHDDLDKKHSVKSYLDQCADKVLDMLVKSNFYNVAQTALSDLLTYSIASVGVQKDEESVLRFYPNSIGTYRVASGPRLDINTHATKRMWTADQLVREFGEEAVSNHVKSAYDAQNYTEQFEVRHLVFDNPDYAPELFSSEYKRFASVWFEKNGESGKILRKSGFDEFPFLVPRWEVEGADTYGSNSPAFLAIGSIKGLQIDQADKHTAKKLKIQPAMIAPESLRGRSSNLFPGGITYVDISQGQQGLTAAYQVNLDTQDVMISIDDTRKSINDLFFVDLFLAVLNIDKSNVTAYEIAQRQSEKMLMLGPVLNRLNEEFLDPVVSMAYAELQRRGMLPEPPEELADTEIHIQYQGQLQMAQKSTEIQTLERGVGFIGNLSGTWSSVLDKVNPDGIVDAYAEATGLPPEIFNDEQTIAAIRQQRAEQAQAEKMAEMAPAVNQTIQGAQLLNEMGGE